MLGGPNDAPFGENFRLQLHRPCVTAFRRCQMTPLCGWPRVFAAALGNQMLAIEKPFRPPAVRNESDSRLINKGKHWVEGRLRERGFTWLFRRTEMEAKRRW
ncbi:unnamed protein product [Musa banksii]